MEIVEEARDVVGRLVEMRLAADRGEAVVLGFAEDEELDLGPEIHAVAHLRRAGPNPAEDVAAARFERRAAATEIGREPRDVGLPGQDHAGVGVGMGGDLFLVDLLRHAVERGARKQFGALHHPVEMGDRHHLGFRGAVHVGIARQQEPDAPLDQLLFQRRRARSAPGGDRPKPELLRSRVSIHGILHPVDSYRRIKHLARPLRNNQGLPPRGGTGTMAEREIRRVLRCT